MIFITHNSVSITHNSKYVGSTSMVEKCVCHHYFMISQTHKHPPWLPPFPLSPLLHNFTSSTSFAAAIPEKDEGKKKNGDRRWVEKVGDWRLVKGSIKINIAGLRRWEIDADQRHYTLKDQH